ncbi:MAG: BrnT family toxin [Acidobacteriota bacterium]
MNERQFQFEWDEAKAAVNLRKHGIPFELASSIFGDPRILTLADTTHSESEGRWFSIGLASNGVPMSIVYLWTDTGAGLTKIRLITARRATSTEIRYYTESQ